MSVYIKQNFPGRNIYVASFPGFAFEKIFYFSEGEKVKNIKTDYHRNFLADFNTDEKYVYVIIFPEVFNRQFKELDQEGKIIDFSDDYSLFVN